MSRLAQIFVVTFVAAGIAFLGLLSGAGQDRARARQEAVDPLKNHYPVDMPRYPGVQEFPLGSGIDVGTSGMRMSYFMTDDEPLKVANFFGDRWRTAHHHVTEDISPAGGVVSAYDPATGVMRQVLIRRESGRTAVFPSVILEALRPSADGTAAADDVPLYPGSEGVLRFGARDPGHKSAVTLFTNYGGVVNNVDFYRSRLPELGWREVAPRAGVPIPEELAKTLMFHKGGRELTINVNLLDKSQRVRVHITEATGRELGLQPGSVPETGGGVRP